MLTQILRGSRIHFFITSFTNALNLLTSARLIGRNKNERRHAGDAYQLVGSFEPMPLLAASASPIARVRRAANAILP